LTRYCDPDQDNSRPAGSLAGLPLVANSLTSPVGNKLDCAALTRIEVGLPAHGSWDRQPPRAPAVLWLAWDSAKGTLEPAVTLTGGFENSDHSYWGRPADAVPGPDGALYVSDDTAGAIYRLAPAT
jgi:hypothetical protein